MGEVTFNGKTYFEPEKETQRAFHEVGIHTFRYYPAERLMVCSDFFVEQFGCEKFVTNMPQGLADMLIDQKDWPELFDMDKRFADGATRVSAIMRTKAGVYSRVTCVTLDRDSSGTATMVGGIVEDQAEDIRTNGVAQALSADYHSLYYVDMDKDAIYPYRLSPAIEKQYGAFFRSNPSYEMAITAYIMNTVVEEERQEMMYLCSYKYLEQQLSGSNTFSHDFRASRDGKTFYCRMKAANVTIGEGLHSFVMGFADVSKERKREIEKLAYTDAVTGGDNYNRFKEKLRESDQSGYMVSMDLYAFKTVNVTCGTSRGDDALRGVHGCIRKNLLPGDIVGHINADHFVIFLKTKVKERVSEVLESIMVDIQELCADMEIPMLVPYYGAALWEPGRGIELTYGEANTAKHESKHRKDMFLAFYTEESSRRLMAQKKMEDDFEPALRNREFEIWLQGKFVPDTREFVGAEALVRWRTSKGELVPPSVFIPLFEKNGQIRRLDEYVFRSVCEAQHRRIQSGNKVVPISVNLSRATLYFRGIVQSYKNIADRIGIDPKLVPIEITESATVSNDEIEALAKEFCEAGFSIHLDDFGSGYSSLATLNVLHFDTLKLDKSLIDYIGDPGGEKLIHHTIALAKDLGMKVLAEGVEHEEQAKFLMGQNCDFIQGYYYGRPLPIEEFRRTYEH